MERGFATDGHAVVLVKVLAAGVWGGCEGLQLSTCLHARDTLHSCYYYYLMYINHCRCSSADAGLTVWLLPTQSQARLCLPVPHLLQIKELIPPSWDKWEGLCH